MRVRYFLIMILSYLVSIVASPYYLSLIPSENSVLIKLAVFLLVWGVLAFLVRKR